jgi:hypothetical protein
MLKKSVLIFVIVAFISFVAYHERELYTEVLYFALEAVSAPEPISTTEAIRAPEAIPAPGPISSREPIPARETLLAFEAIQALRPTQVSEKNLVGTAAATERTEYGLSSVFQWRSFSEHKVNFWMILVPLVLTLIAILVFWKVYCHFGRFSYREEVTTEKPSQPRIVEYLCERVLLELRDMLTKRQELKELSGQVQKELKTLKIVANVKDENLMQLLSEVDSLKMITKGPCENYIQLLSDSIRKMEVEHKHPANFRNEVDSVRTVEEEDERTADIQDEDRMWKEQWECVLQEFIATVARR